jgi:hypothetical protein
MRTVYTCIVGDYDDLKEPINRPPNAHQNWKFICFTDNPNIKTINAYEEEIPRNESIWEIRPIQQRKETDEKTARWHKINFHKVIETQESMWIDGTFFINTDLKRWWRRNNNHEFTAINHPFDDCPYKDIRSCISAEKGDTFTLMRQALHYKDDGLPENYGLIASGILMRRLTNNVTSFCEKWWDEVERYTQRDQSAFSYVKWKTKADIHLIDWNYTKESEFMHVPHLWKERIRNERFKAIKKMV